MMPKLATTKCVLSIFQRINYITIFKKNAVRTVYNYFKDHVICSRYIIHVKQFCMMSTNVQNI